MKQRNCRKLRNISEMILSKWKSLFKDENKRVRIRAENVKEVLRSSSFLQSHDPTQGLRSAAEVTSIYTQSQHTNSGTDCALGLCDEPFRFQWSKVRVQRHCELMQVISLFRCLINCFTLDLVGRWTLTSARRLRPQTDRPPSLLHRPPYHLSSITKHSEQTRPTG